MVKDYYNINADPRSVNSTSTKAGRHLQTPRTRQPGAIAGVNNKLKQIKPWLIVLFTNVLLQNVKRNVEV